MNRRTERPAMTIIHRAACADREREREKCGTEGEGYNSGNTDGCSCIGNSYSLALTNCMAVWHELLNVNLQQHVKFYCDNNLCQKLLQ